MSSLSFIPRKLAKKTSSNKPEHTKNNDEKGKLPPQRVLSPVAFTPDVNREVPAKYNDVDYATVIALSLSDYALWLDADLRQKLGTGLGDGHGYVSLDYLLGHSTALASLLEAKPGKEFQTIRSKVQAATVKGIRMHANDLLDIRLLLHSDQSVPRFGKQKEVVGGYEVRRKRLGTTLRGKSEWDACTLYLENIPPGYRSYAEIIRFLNGLLCNAPPIPSSSMFPVDRLTRIQGITFPLHHNDRPDTRPSCKGFALVTFAHVTDCEYLQQSWPWLPQDANETTKREAENKLPTKTPSEAIDVARQHNFRVITKRRWLELKAEYLTYRQRLVEEINAHQDALRTTQTQSQDLDVPAAVDQSRSTLPSVCSSSTAEHPIAVTISPFSPYPPDCLVFVKHVHPETTKTTLRNLFSQAFQSQQQTGQKNVEGLDYVDFSKGMDTCYLRLAAPRYTASLVDYFNHGTRRIVQVSGIDQTGVDAFSVGTSAAEGLEPIVVDRIIGAPEEIYWEKVPAKVKKAAVGRAMQLAPDPGWGDDGLCSDGFREQKKRNKDVNDCPPEGESVRKKKRRYS